MFKRIIFLAFILVSFLLSCNVKNKFEARSGTIYDDYIEEPLSDIVKKFESNLYLSNEMITLIKDKKLELLYHDFFSSEFKSISSLEQITNMFDYIFKKYGEIKEYKLNQWNFKIDIIKKREVLFCIKIIHHENGILYYYFIFDNKSTDNLIGFQYGLRE